MAQQKITGKELRALGYPEGRAIGVAIRVMEKHFRGKGKNFQLSLLKAVFSDPHGYKNHETLKLIAHNLLIKTEHNHTIPLRNQKVSYEIFGAEGIEPGAIHQMEQAMKLAITKAGALMPDAHHGYGLPIGGVLAAENAVIPYGVGVDIGCRMCLSLFDLPVSDVETKHDRFVKLLNENSRFGQATFDRPLEDPIMSRPEFNDIPIAKNMKDRAYKQLGSSGGGNHFVEFGLVELTDPHNEFDLPVGNYVGLLTHSGSRGLGANIARVFTALAKDLCKLPDDVRHLAWLGLDSDAGQEYWAAMSLAGDYASACHHQIHERVARAIGQRPLGRVENHHNFAWKEQLADGANVIVHRKGATPAGKGVLGIIPGSMTSPGFIVRGRGAFESLNSASHGAGRVLSRTKAKAEVKGSEVKKLLEQNGVTVIGSGLDEAPQAYKNIHKVMAAQQELVDVLGAFYPKVVRMCGDEKLFEVD